MMEHQTLEEYLAEYIGEAMSRECPSSGAHRPSTVPDDAPWYDELKRWLEEGIKKYQEDYNCFVNVE
jgi:hypothetical protein